MESLSYLRQKLLVSLLRILAYAVTFFVRRYDQQLAKSTFPGLKTTILSIPSRDNGRSIKAYLYHPSQDAASTSSNSPKPVLVNWHGSGFIMPSLGSDAFYCVRIAHEAGVFVLDADYRKSPETRYPGAVHDAEDLLNWVSTQAQLFDSQRVAVSGFSAGANIALVMASVLRKTLKVNIQVAMGLYPLTDLALASEAKKVSKPVNPIPPAFLDIFNESYVPDKAMRNNPMASPSYANVDDFPATVVMVTADGDVLAPEANSLAEKLDNGKRKVVHVQVKDVGHGFDKGAKEGKQLKAREHAYNVIVRALKENL